MANDTITVLITVLMTAVVGQLLDNRRTNTLRQEMKAGLHREVEGLKELWRSELRRVEEVLDARLKHFEEH